MAIRSGEMVSQLTVGAVGADPQQAAIVPTHLNEAPTFREGSILTFVEDKGVVSLPPSD